MERPSGRPPHQLVELSALLRRILPQRKPFVLLPSEGAVFVRLAQCLDAPPGSRVIFVAMLVAAEVCVDALSYQRYPFSTVTTAHAAQHRDGRRLPGRQLRPPSSGLIIGSRLRYLPELKCSFSVLNQHL